MRCLMKVIFNVKLTLNAQTQALQAVKTFFVYITRQRETPDSWASLPGQYSPPGQLCSAPQTSASETPVASLLLEVSSPRREGNFKTRDTDCFYFSMPGQNIFFLIFWFQNSKSCDDHNNSIRLEEKTKKCWSLKQRLSCSSHPLLCSLLTVISPWNWTTAWTSFPVTLNYHIPCLCDTICFLLQLFSSVAKHSSEMTPSPLICSQNPLLAPWVGHVCLSPGSEKLQLHHCDLVSHLFLFLPSSQSFLERECPSSSKSFPVKPVSTPHVKS